MSAPPPPEPAPPTPVRLASVTVSDFRAFPGGPPFIFNLGDRGKNLLLHGENGAGKSSLFHALRLLFSPRVPTLLFGAYTNVFLPARPANPGTVAVNLTAGTTLDYLWNAGTPHPAANLGDVTFREIARRAVFLDYKELLKTSLPHEDQQAVDLFDLVVGSLLRDVEFPNGQSVAQAWETLRTFQPQPPPERDDDSGMDDDDPAEWPDDAEQWRMANTGFWNLFIDLLNRIVPRANRYLAEHLQPHLTVELTAALPDQDGIGPRRGLFLTADYARYRVEHPAQFLNEARLSAIALALYLAATVETKPPAYASSATGERYLLPRLLVLDDPLLGFDLAHRSTLPALLQRAEWADWQVFLFTYDLGWYELASDAFGAGQLTDDKSWVKYRLHARLHQVGWEMPVLMSDAPFLDRAGDYLQDGDYKAAGVYLRVGFESMLRDLCIERSQHVPLKENLRDYRSEDLWPVVARYVVKGVGPLVDEGLKSEINLQRRYVLNPLCHNDPARPTREEVRRAYAALHRLRTLIAQDTAWPEQLNLELQEAARAIVADDAPRLERALMGYSHPREFALLSACRLLTKASPPMLESALLLRSAFDRMLWRYCNKKGLSFIVKCDARLSTRDLWDEAKLGANGLAATQASFVASIESQDDLFLMPDPMPDVCRGKSPTDLEGLCQLFAGTSWRADTNPKAVMDNF